MKLVLASGSPRRRKLLELLNIEHVAISADIDEIWLDDESPSEYVNRLSVEKAMYISESIQVTEDTLVVGGDLTIDLDGRAVAKAKDPDEAKEMITSLSGRQHFIRDGLAVVRENEIVYQTVESNIVEFKELSSEQIDDYIQNHEHEWRDKAAAYAIQGYARNFIKHYTGSYLNIVGMPIFSLAQFLISYGFEIDHGKVTKLRNLDKKEDKIAA